MSEQDRERLAKFSDDDLQAMMDMVKMYKAGRAAICKAVIYAVTGAIVTAVGLGIKHYFQSIINQ